MTNDQYNVLKHLYKLNQLEKVKEFLSRFLAYPGSNLTSEEKSSVTEISTLYQRYSQKPEYLFLLYLRVNTLQGKGRSYAELNEHFFIPKTYIAKLITQLEKERLVIKIFIVEDPIRYRILLLPERGFLLTQRFVNELFAEKELEFMYGN
ncbi:MAG: hypothetical protein BAJALOKI1v1_1190007 [Promethearchaeota archaeon]|nr:MAG: hypothetical protein BAJALOKI1v1_1190007 [Candidatus Lokiarchaeota archaeon]